MSTRRTDHLTFGAVVSHLGVLIAVSAVMGLLVAGLAIPFEAALGFGTHTVANSMKNLPEALQTNPLSQRSRVLDTNGKVIATFYDQNRVNVTLSQVAPIMRTAIVAIEDDRYYEHGAIDVKGTLRAFLTNQANDGVTQGGSSITQQMAKLTLLAQATTKAQREAATADTYQRKILELRHAIAFEQHYSKDWILDRYLNLAYFGDGAYGIEAAARHYFGVHASKLDTAQAALLAGLVKNPTGYDPSNYPERALARRNVVLDRMAQLNKIPAAEAQRLDTTRLNLHLAPTRNGCLGSRAAFFCDYVQSYLLADPSLGKTVEDRKELLNNGGLTIKTTVDMRFQKAADASTAAHVKATDNAIGALAMVQPGSGDVLAISQSRPMGRNKRKGETFLDYAVPKQYGDSNGFQGGSTFKLFVLATALEQGLPPSTSFRTPPALPIVKNTFPDCDGNYADPGTWVVHNSTDNGPVTNMYSGMQLSVNNYFAQLERKTGLCEPFQLAKEMGVPLNNPDTERVPTFTLGVADVSPLTMAGAYATVAARGLYCTARPVTQILNSDDQVFKNYPKQCTQVMQQSTADRINDILRGVMTGSGFGAPLALDKPSAGKTGTTDSNMSVWFDGYTPTVATASMVAGVNAVGHHVTLNNQVIGGSFVSTAHGSTTAGPMWADAMRAIQDDIPNVDFVKPAQAFSTSSFSTIDGTGQGTTQGTTQGTPPPAAPVIHHHGGHGHGNGHGHRHGPGPGTP